MRLGRLFGLMFLSVLTVGVVVASSASAYQYLGPLQTFTVHVSPVFILGGAAAPEVHCQGGKGTGVVHPLSLNNLSGVVIKVTGCIAEEKGVRCGTIKSSSPEGAEGEIITRTLRGLLGVLGGTKEDPAVLSQPQEGTTFMTLASVPGCTNAVETAVKGSVIGALLLPLLGLRLDLHILLSGRPSILLLKTLVLDKYTLEAYGAQETIDTLSLLLFEKEFEIC